MRRVINALIHPVMPLLVLVIGLITMSLIWFSMSESDFAYQVQAMKTAQAPFNVTVAFDEPPVTLAPRPARTAMFRRRPTITALPTDILRLQPIVTPWPTDIPLWLGATNNVQWPTPPLHLIVPAPLVPTTPIPLPQVAAPPAPTLDTRSGQRRGAICRDGTTSSATGSGACSWHGGVDHWLVYP